MFTGLITHLAEVQEKQKRTGSLHLKFRVLGLAEKLKPGESIAVNGVCLTAINTGRGVFEVDVVGDTLKATTLGAVSAGDKVNIERSLKAADAVGGHYVTGHVDARGRIKRLITEKGNTILTVEAPAKLFRYIFPKGSVAVDGVSLTVQRVREISFDIALVPHTLRSTVFSARKTGDEVNLEVDVLARYMESALKAQSKRSALSVARLKKQGF